MGQLVAGPGSNPVPCRRRALYALQGASEADIAKANHAILADVGLVVANSAPFVHEMIADPARVKRGKRGKR